VQYQPHDTRQSAVGPDAVCLRHLCSCVAVTADVRHQSLTIKHLLVIECRRYVVVDAVVVVVYFSLDSSLQLSAGPLSVNQPNITHISQPTLCVLDRC